VLVDQVTKWLVICNLPVDSVHVVIDGFFSLVNWRNTGAAWGMLQGWNIVLILLSLATFVGLFVFRNTFQLHRPICRIALGLIMGGILGNLIDRVRFGYVVDFLLFYIRDYPWPAFNVADSGICVGVGLYIIGSWRQEKKDNVKPA